MPKSVPDLLGRLVNACEKKCRVNFHKKQLTYLSGFRKRGAEKRVRPSWASGQPMRKKFSVSFYKKQLTYLSGFRKRGAEKRARPTGASGQPIRKKMSSEFFQKNNLPISAASGNAVPKSVPDLLGRLVNP